MYLLIKIIQRIFSPLPLGILSLVLVLIVARKGVRWVRSMALAGLFVLLPASLPLVADCLIARLEAYAPAAPLENLPVLSTLVVLGGTAAPQWGGGYQAEELAGSRLLTAFRIYRLQKAQKIIVTSGIRYQTQAGVWRTEAEDMRDILVTMGVPEAAIVTEARALNTKENATYTALLLRDSGFKLDEEIFLVSSAYHMQRASLWFKKAGLRVRPVGAGRSVPLGFEVTDIIPSAAALTRSSAVLKEYLGLIPMLF